MPKIQASAPAFAGFRQLPGGGFPFTMVPNQFLDEIVPIEKPCVVKVVCLVLRRTLGWIDQTGQRRQQDQVAYSEFAREMNMSTQAVADGLKIALEKGYIVRVKAGTMRDAASGNPEAASYSLRWMSPLQPLANQTPSPNKETKKETPNKEEAKIEETGDSEILAETAPEADSENQTVLPSLINRDMINKADSEKKIKVELKPSSKISETKKAGKFSEYLGKLVSDIGQVFGDEKHRLSNIKQALNCWEKSGLPEKDFAQVLYQARDLTRQHTNSVKNPTTPAMPAPPQKFSSWITLAGEASFGETPQTAATNSPAPRNRMPYFFKVLQDLIRRPASATTETPPEKMRESVGSPVSSQEKPSLHNKVRRFVPRQQEGESTSPVETSSQTMSDAAQTPSVFEELPKASKTPVAVEKLPEAPVLAEVPAELVRLTGRFSTADESVLNAWQDWEASLQDSRLKALGRRLIFLEKSQVRPELWQFLFNPVRENSTVPSKEIVLVFRNSFDSRYAATYINEIAASLEDLFHSPIKLVITHG